MNKAIATINIGDRPMVIMPLEQYEQLQEDLEMLRSSRLPKKVAEARAQLKKGQVLTTGALKKALSLG